MKPLGVTGLELQPDFDAAVQYAEDGLVQRTKSPCHGVFVFDAFSRDYCKRLLAKIAEHQHLAIAPNTMNRYGLVLKDAGMGWLCEQLLHLVVNPLAHRHYPHLKPSSKYHGFIVNYDPKKQASLDLHEDDSLVTLNICLGTKFTGGKLVFRDRDAKTEKIGEVEHKIGQAVLHLGSQLHQAQNIRTGKRSNLILWCKR